MTTQSTVRTATINQYKQLTAYPFDIENGIAEGRLPTILLDMVNGEQSHTHFSIELVFKMDVDSLDILEISAEKPRISTDNGWSYTDIDYVIGERDLIPIEMVLTELVKTYPNSPNQIVMPALEIKKTGERVTVGEETDEDYTERWLDGAEGMLSAVVDGVLFPVQFNADITTDVKLAKWEDGVLISDKVCTVTSIELTRCVLGDNQSSQDGNIYYLLEEEKWIDYEVSKEDMTLIKQLIIETIKQTPLA